MIKYLNTLKECYRDKNIFLWGVDHYSVNMLGMLAFQRIKIKGIFTDKVQYIGKTYWNVPIVNFIEDVKESIIVTSDYTVPQNVPNDIVIVQYSKLFQMDKKINGGGVIIYGAGQAGRQQYEDCVKHGIKVDAFCVTNKRVNNSEYLGCPIISLDEIGDADKHNIILAAFNIQSKKEMLESIRKKGWDVYVNIDDVVSMTNMNEICFVQGIQKALIEDSKIILFTKKDLICELIEDALSIYEIEIAEIIWKECDPESSKNIWDLAYEDISKLFVIINEIDRIELQTSCELLEQIGFSLGDLNYVGIRNVAAECKNRIQRKYDILTGNSIVVDDKLPGCTVHGTARKDDIKIAILGGSTSTDAYYRVESWPSLLYKQLVQSGINSTIYNFAHPGEDVVQEILRLLRDVWHIHPDYVISMSGVNNFVEKQPAFRNEFLLKHLINIEHTLYSLEQCVHGIKSDENPYEFWLRMEKIEAAICETYGVKFLSYLQPQKTGMSNMSLLEESMFTYEGVHGAEGKVFRDSATENEIYTNLLSLFDHESDMFFDCCHYTLKANRILADKVFQDIKLSMI